MRDILQNNGQEADGQFDAMLSREIEAVVHQTLEHMRSQNHSLIIKHAHSPALTVKDTSTLKQTIQDVYLRHAYMDVQGEGQAADAFTIAKSKGPQSREVVFGGQTASVLKEYAHLGNRTEVVALGLYLDRRFHGGSTTISFSELAAAAGISHSHATGELRTKFLRKKKFGDWEIAFENDGEHFSFNHIDDAVSIARRTFQKFLYKKVNVANAERICTLLIEKYTGNGHALSVLEIKDALGIEQDEEVLRIMELLRQSITELDEWEIYISRMSNGPKEMEKISVQGDANSGWFLIEPGEKTLLQNFGRHPMDQLDGE